MGEYKAEMRELHRTRLAGDEVPTVVRDAKFGLGQIVRHRFYPFRGVIFDVDPTFNHTEEWWQSIPEAIRPHKDQPFYHLLAENDSSHYVAYVSEQNLLLDDDKGPIKHPQVNEMFDGLHDGAYIAKQVYN
ncbi:MAG TPA: heat shock protein HspQ [Terriglobales bacterium]|nr:heat shock protein HspQ [Terriglobales bacterium]